MDTRTLNQERLAGARTYARQRADATGCNVRLFLAYGQIHVAFADADYSGESIEVIQPAPLGRIGP